jgi:hypothetical protein
VRVVKRARGRGNMSCVHHGVTWSAAACSAQRVSRRLRCFLSLPAYLHRTITNRSASIRFMCTAAHGAAVTLHTRVQRSCFCEDFRTTCTLVTRPSINNDKESNYEQL